MLVEWLDKTNKKRRNINPKDGFRYIVSTKVVEFTEAVLRQYSNLRAPAEGLVYWSGSVKNNIYYIRSGFAPQTKSWGYGILTTHESNADFVDFISDNDLVYIAQVHSHPSKWVDHSQVDNEETAFRSEGLVSVVVPDYSTHGMLPLMRCGIHRYSNSHFKRLSNKYINNHFMLEQLNNVILKDCRNGK